MNRSGKASGNEPEHPLIAELTKDWSAARRARFKTFMADRAAEVAAGNIAPKPAFAYPVPRGEMDRLLPAGLRTYLRLAEEMGLARGELIGLLGLPAATHVPEPGELGEEQFYRLSYFLGIYAHVGSLLGKDEAIRWFTAPCRSEEMSGRSPISYLIEQGLPGFDYLHRAVADWANNGG